MTATGVLAAKGVALSYGRTQALRGVDVSVSPGEVLAVVGSSGSGKTSLLYCLSGMLAPTAGQVMLTGQLLPPAGSAAMAKVRREHFGFVFQFAELVPELTLAENVALPLELLKVPAQQRRQRVAQILDQFGIAEHAARRAEAVSGGQAQRAAIARALVHRPSVIFADEPTGSLDSDNANTALGALLSAAREASAAVVLVTHDSSVAAAADRSLVLRDGREHLAP